jgi:hypothetical protein
MKANFRQVASVQVIRAIPLPKYSKEPVICEHCGNERFWLIRCESCGCTGKILQKE